MKAAEVWMGDFRGANYLVAVDTHSCEPDGNYVHSGGETVISSDIDDVSHLKVLPCILSQTASSTDPGFIPWQAILGFCSKSKRDQRSRRGDMWASSEL
jgi:hypothetical protein